MLVNTEPVKMLASFWPNLPSKFFLPSSLIYNSLLLFKYIYRYLEETRSLGICKLLMTPGYSHSN